MINSFTLLFSWLITVLEWYEFAIYNSIAIYFPKILGNNNKSMGFLILAISFLARPIGSILFARISDKNKALQSSLTLMLISTILIGIAPVKMPYAYLFILVCKLLQGFAIGGSYGMNYLGMFEEEEEKPIENRYTHSKIAFIQTGFIIGSLLGESTTTIFKILLQNDQDFIAWGWRMPFILSATFAFILLLSTQKIKISSNSNNIKSKTNFLEYSINRPGKVIKIFSGISLEMFLFYFWLVYLPCVKEIDSSITSNYISMFQKLVIVFFFPLAGYIVDKITQAHKRALDNLVLICVCFSFVLINILLKNHEGWFVLFSSIAISMCYASLIPWVINQFSPKNRHNMIGPIFNIAGSLVGGFVPFYCCKIEEFYGLQAVYFLISCGMIIPASAFVVDRYFGPRKL